MEMGVDLCPNHFQFDQSTKLRSTTLQNLNGYICIHLRWFTTESFVEIQMGRLQTDDKYKLLILLI